MELYSGVPKPAMVSGFEVAGVVDKAGAQVKGLREGDPVLAWLRSLGRAVVAHLTAGPSPRSGEGRWDLACPVKRERR